MKESESIDANGVLPFFLFVCNRAHLPAKLVLLSERT